MQPFSMHALVLDGPRQKVPATEEMASVSAPLLTEAVFPANQNRKSGMENDMPAARKMHPLAVQKFDPAPHDKYAADPKQAAQADRASHSTLSIGLILSFPASDPISAIQPALPSRADQ